MKGGPLVLTRTFPVLAPNNIVAAVGKIDQKLNPALELSLRSRLRSLQLCASAFSAQRTWPDLLLARPGRE
jgi:hypothetical protein